MAERSRLAELTQPEFEQALRELAGQVAFTEADVAAAVEARLEAAPRTGEVVGVRPRRRMPRVVARGWVAVAAAVVAFALVLSGVLVLSPSARRAVAGWLGLGGVRVEVTPTVSPPAPLGEELFLGDRMTLGEAEEEVSFDILLPDLGPPDEVYVSSPLPDGLVSLVYAARPGLPAAPETEVGLLLVEIRASLGDEAFIHKVVGPGTTVEPVTVNGGRGFWLSGEPHVVLYLDADGRPIEDSVRLAGDVLLWEQGDVTLRLESALSKEEALRIAETVR